MKEYITTLCAAALMVSLCTIILPEGSIKKYATLAGSVIISLAIVLPLGNLSRYGEVDYFMSFTEGEMTEIDAREQYGRILMTEYTKSIEESLKEYGRVYVSVNSEMEVEKIDIYTSRYIAPEEEAYIKKAYNPHKLEVHYE